MKFVKRFTLLFAIAVAVIIGIMVLFPRQVMKVSDAAEKARVKPAMPILLSFRKAVMGGGAVATFKNPTDKIFAFKAKFHSPALNKNHEFDFVLDPGKTKEIGHTEGWPVAPGDTVEIESAGYTPTKTTLQP